MTTPQSPKVNVAIDLRFIVGALLIIIVAMLLIWRPWAGISDRTIEVTGQTTLKAVPDAFVFYPRYEFKNANKDIALAELTKKNDQIVAKLKELGVPEASIKTSSSGYDAGLIPESEGKGSTYTLQLTVNVDNKELAQKAQDYLVTTAPSGTVSPQPMFSEAKQKELESAARDQATKDAKQKANQTANNLGFALGSVKAVRDGLGFGGAEPYPVMETDGSVARSSLGLHPGENELSYSVTVTYYIR